MAKTRDYMDYLDDNVKLAPATSQEEYQAAETIANVLRDHKLDTSVEEFETRPWGVIIPSVLVVIMFVCLIVAKFAAGPARMVTLLIALLMAGLTIFVHYTGSDILRNLGPTASSQNVIAIHRATGSKVVKGARPIVIVAHYDTPREDFLRMGPLARYQPALRMTSIFCHVAVAVSVIFQIIPFVPSVVQTILWVVALIVMLPLLMLAASDIYKRVSPYTPGSNDNKASIAAMLAIANKVRPTGDRVDEEVEQAGPGRLQRRRAKDAPPAPPAPQRIEIIEEVRGVRHGAEVLKSLGILPPDCEIVYEEPRVQIVEQAAVDVISDAPAAQAEEEPRVDEAETTESVQETSEEVGQPSSDDVGEADAPIEDDVKQDEDVKEEYAQETERQAEDDVADDRDEIKDTGERGAKDTYEDEEKYNTKYEKGSYDEEYEEEPYDDDSYDEEEYEEEYDESEDSYDEDDYDEEYEEPAPASSGAVSRVSSWFSSRIDEVKDFLSRNANTGDDGYEEESYEESEEEYEDDEYDEYEEYDEEETDEDEEAYDDDDDEEHVEEEPESDEQDEEYYDEDEDEDEISYDDEEYEEEYDESEDSYDEEEYDGEDYDETEQDDEGVVYDEDESSEDYDDERRDDAEYDDEYDDNYDDDDAYDDNTYDDDDSYYEEEYDERENDQEADYDEDGYEDEADDAEYEGEPIEEYEPKPSIAGRISNFFKKIRIPEKDIPGHDERGEDEGYYAEEDSRYAYVDRSGEREVFEYAYGEEDLYDEADDRYAYEENDVASSVEQQPEKVYPEEVEEAQSDSYTGKEENERNETPDYDAPYYTEEDYDEDPVGEVSPRAATTDEKDPATKRPVDPNELHLDREEDADVLPKDISGIDVISDSYDLYTEETVRAGYEKPEPPTDPGWGVSSYQPALPSINIARRAALFDLPDPSSSVSDPFEDNYEDYDDEYDEYQDVKQTEEIEEVRESAEKQIAPVVSEQYEEVEEVIEVEEPPAAEEPPVMEEPPVVEEPKQTTAESNEAATTTEDEEKKSFWGPADKWKGGAAVREDLRDQDAPIVIDADDLQDAILELGDEFLVAHDIWFVATGASEINHAGMQAFMENHKRDIRGAFLVNLECVGAGNLSVVVQEGFSAPRRADRRLVRMITSIAQDLHIQIENAQFGWGESDSATAMRSRVRSVTLAGLDENVIPAYSNCSDDVPENVYPKQVYDVVRIVTELIRRA